MQIKKLEDEVAALGDLSSVFTVLRVCTLRQRPYARVPAPSPHRSEFTAALFRQVHLRTHAQPPGDRAGDWRTQSDLAPLAPERRCPARLPPSPRRRVPGELYVMALFL